jgi:hypothetical protein
MRKKKKPELTSAPANEPLHSEVLVGFGEAPGSAEVLDPSAQAFQKNLLSLLSHELRTPLMGIVNGMTLLEMERPSEQRTSGELLAFEQIRRNADRLQSLIQNLTELAILEAGAFRVELREVSLLSWLQENRTGHGLPLPTSPAAPAFRVLLDPEKFRRALQLTLRTLTALGMEPDSVEVLDRGSPTLAFWFKSPDSDRSRKLEQDFHAGVALSAGGTLSPQDVLRFAAAPEEEFLRIADEQSGLSRELPWALVRHALQAQEISLELLHEAETPRRLLFLFAFPARETRARAESLLRSRLLSLEGAQGADAQLSLLWIESEKGEPLPEGLRQELEDLADHGDTILELDRPHALLWISERRTPEGLLQDPSKPLSLKFGQAHFPKDGADARTLLDHAERSLSPLR